MLVRIAALLLCLGMCLSAGTVTLDFEPFSDGDLLTTQYSGVTFSNAVILTAGISLNDFEFPPRSGTNVASDNAGPMSIDFSAPVLSFGGYFTYLEPLTLQAFDASNNPIGSATSAFLNNMALSGDPGSSPNEFLQVSFASGISSVTITGDPAGGSFTLDDATYTTGAAVGSTVPEPSSLVLVFFGLITVWFARSEPVRCTGTRRPAPLPKRHGCVIAIVFGCIIGAPLTVAQSVGLPTASPAAVTVGVSTAITVTSFISIPNVIGGGVNLLGSANGQAQSVLGQLHDDGVNGDLVANDQVYSGIVNVKAPQTGKLALMVSVATRGTLRRTVSNAFSIDVLPVGVPTEPTAPDFSHIVVDPVSGTSIVADEVLACFTAATSFGTVTAIANSFGGTVIGRFSALGNCFQFGLPLDATSATVYGALGVLKGRPEVTSAEPDVVRDPASFPCASPILPTCLDPSYASLRLDDAHAISSGAGVIVAVLDTGVDYTNETLNPAAIGFPRIIKGHNFTTEPVGLDPMDNDGHGTSVAGIIAATAPQSYILAIKVGNPKNTEGSSTLGILDAVNSGARIINMSYGDPLGSANDESFEILAANYAIAHNRVLIASAGNHGKSDPVEYPAAIFGVLSVGATDNGADNAPFSNFGSWVHLGAPGVNVVSTGLTSAGGSYSNSGTSFAAPFVSGVAALLWSVNPFLTNTQIVDEIEKTARQESPPLPFVYGRLSPLNNLSVSFSNKGKGTVTSTAVDYIGRPVTNPPNLSCTAACSTSFLGLASVALTATAAAGSTFKAWGGDCSGTNATVSVTLMGDRTCTVEFTPPTLTVQIQGNGTVTSTPGDLNCGASQAPCSATFDVNTVVALTASGTGFSGWTGDCLGSETSTSVTMTSDRTCIATFGPSTTYLPVPEPQHWSLLVTQVNTFPTNLVQVFNEAEGNQPGSFFYYAFGEDTAKANQILHDALTCSNCDDPQKIKWLFEGSATQTYPLVNSFESGTQTFSIDAHAGILTETVTNEFTQNQGGTQSGTLKSVYEIQSGLASLQLNIATDTPSAVWTQSGFGSHVWVLQVTHSSGQ